jgi:hypothetical protein
MSLSTTTAYKNQVWTPFRYFDKLSTAQLNAAHFGHPNVNERLVYAEIESVTEEMRNDKRVLIISDNALFMVTTKTNSKWYNYYFELCLRRR